MTGLKLGVNDKTVCDHACLKKRGDRWDTTREIERWQWQAGGCSFPSRQLFFLVRIRALEQRRVQVKSKAEKGTIRERFYFLSLPATPY